MQRTFSYDQTHNQYVSNEDANIKIKQGSEIRYKLDQIKYDKGDIVRIKCVLNKCVMYRHQSVL